MCKVMVAMCVYAGDRPDFIKIAIDSVLNDGFPVDFYVVIDGPVSAQIREVLNQYTDVIRLIDYPINKGLAHGLNRLIDICVAENYTYFARMDADDISLPGRFQAQVNFLAEFSKVSVVGAGCNEFGSSFALNANIPPSSHEEIQKYAVLRNPIIHPTVMIRADVFKDGVKYPVDTVLAEDLALWYSMIEKGYKFANLQDIYIRFRLSEHVIHRRSGYKKAHSEFLLRYAYAKNMGLLSISRVFKLLIKFGLQVSPSFLIRWAYKTLR